LTVAKNKTQATTSSPDDFIAAFPDPVRRDDARSVAALMARISGEPATMWGPSIIGFGTCHYRYESGREGDMPRISFSPRKAETVLYLTDGFPGHAELMARLGKLRTGKSCLYVKRLSDVDMAVLEELIAASWADVARRYPEDQMPAYQS
jgi:hypothetical protein